MPQREGHIVVLVVEDDPDHAALIDATLVQNPHVAVVIKESAEAAVDYLIGKDGPPDRERFPLPDVIVLDLGMPGMGGMGFLEWRSKGFGDPEWREVDPIPVVVFTSSDDPETTWRCYSLGAREVRVKPPDFEALGSTVIRVLNRWLDW